MSRRRPLLIVLAAWAVRLIYIAQIRKAPYFDVPLIDGANYFRMASLIASGDLLGGPRVFWQPPLYPYFLAALLSVFGRRMGILYAIQAAIGSLSCLLVYAIGRRLFSERAALCAAGVMILYGPLIHFDAQPLIPVLHVALVLAGLLLLLRAAGLGEAGDGERRAGSAPAPHAGRDGLLAGIAWGLAALATPNVLLAVPAAAAWAIGRMRAARQRVLALFLIGVAAPVALAALRNVVVARQLVLISSNGGINFFIGNNPDYERTIRIRPGGEFERLAQEPENLGIVGEDGRSWYFTKRALQFLGGYPREALRLYARKGLDLIAGREIPRNQDAYTYRTYSSLLAILLWRFGVSFPFGVVAPLALAGAFLPREGRAADGAPSSGAAASGGAEAGWRSGRGLLLLYAAAYAVSILLFFPTDRYRLPLVPIAALCAGRLLGAPRSAWRRPRVIATLLAGLVLFNLDACTPGERYPEEEALNRAYALRTEGRLEAAREEYREAIALNPDRIDPYNALAAMAAQEGKWEEAAQRYRELLEIAPDFVEVRHALGQAYVALGRRDDARREWQIAAALAPGAGLVLADLCLSLRDEGAFAAAEPYCDQAVRVRPDLPETHFARGVLARALRKTDLARGEIAEALRLFPSDSPGRARAERILRRMKEREEKGHADDARE
jgi:tetratricopeptide (TPR) repeat protein